MNKLKDIKLKNQIIIVTYIMVFVLIIFRPKFIPAMLDKFIVAFKPFIIGGVIAFLINLPMKLIEEKCIKPICKKSKRLENLSRTISLICTFLVVTIILWIFTSYVAPQLIDSLKSLTDNIPKYISGLQSEIISKAKNIHIFENSRIDIQSIIQKLMTYIENFINMFISNLFSFTMEITNFIVNLFLGLIISIYILISKERLGLQFRKFIYAFFNEKKCENILYILKLTNYKFSRFILGQSIDGLILGIAFFIAFSIAKIPFAILISILIPILNFIPIFGTYIGIGISAFIILMVKPSAVILFLVLIFTIQQLDGKFVYPIVVGNSLGLSPLWILLAIIVGGNLFGVIGMIVGMPIVSLVYELLSKDINDRIARKKYLDKKFE